MAQSRRMLPEQALARKARVGEGESGRTLKVVSNAGMAPGGGRGQTGAKGNTGGNGGNGGDIVIDIDQRNPNELFQNIIVESTQGGGPGEPGNRGRGGAGGQGGAPDEPRSPRCGSAARGAGGPEGLAGLPGDPGQAGQDGVIIDVALIGQPAVD